MIRPLILALALGGCSTVVVEPRPLDGSKADGVVELGYELGGLVLREGDWAAGERRAAQVCRDWGYTDAKPFGEPFSRCSQFGEGAYDETTERYQESSCLRRQRVARFQCID